MSAWNKLTQKEVLKRFKKVHFDAYDYSLVEYEGQSKKVIIVCHVHGDFNQIPSSHLVGRGCPDCGLIQRKEKRKSSRVRCEGPVFHRTGHSPQAFSISWCDRRRRSKLSTHRRMVR